TYKEKTQTWKFGPPYPRGIYWMLEVFSIVSAIIVIVIFTKGAILLPLIPMSGYMKPAFPWGISILMIALAIMIPSFLFVFIYSPREVHLTYDEIVLIKGFWGIMRKRIPYCEMREVELVYSGKTSFAPDSDSETLFSLAKYILKTNVDKIVKNDKDFMVSIGLNNGKTCDFQVEDPQEFVKLVKEKMGKFDGGVIKQV
ncbi:MAG: hypothetical protein MUO85_03930, partial [candidate division Zixibacteria bacterium]|nr:hypothetical protein [candidate division Zixibacteria bacterium]